MKINHLYLYTLFAGVGFFPVITSAQELGRLTRIPFVSDTAGIGELVYGLYLVAITIAAVFAVVKLAIAGITYMTSDVVSSKESAKSSIKGAVLGLLLLLMTVLLVDLINPNIADTDISLPVIIGDEWDDDEDDCPPSDPDCLDDFPEGTVIERCSTGFGPGPTCNSESTACRNGDLLPDGEAGNPTIRGMPGGSPGEAAVFCAPDGSGTDDGD